MENEKIDNPKNLPLQQNIVEESVCLTENQIAELANIGSQHLYLNLMDEGRLSYLGVLEIIKKYEELRLINRNS